MLEPSASRTTYGWDFENQNTLVRLPTGARVTMAYNADVRRVRKDHNITTTHVIWDVENDSYLMETDGDGNPTAEYTHEPGLHGELISQRRNGQTYYHHFDGEGNTRAVTDQNGNIVETATYSAFGEVVEKTSSIVNPFGYRGALGYYANPETNDMYVRARTLSGHLGRWLSLDPAAFIDGPNGYMYALNVSGGGKRYQNGGGWLGLLKHFFCHKRPQHKV